MSDSDKLDKQVDSWLAPLSGSDGPCGPDLEYDNAFMELAKAAEGKPETQFEKGAPPEWRIVAGKVEEMFQRTRDLRVAMMWLRATLALHGVVALAAGLRLLLGLLEAHWDQLHPRPDPDDNDPFARANVLAVLPKPDGVTGEVVQSRLLSVKGVGEVRMRDVETAFGIIAAKKGETTFSKEQIDQMIAAAEREGAGIRKGLSSALDLVKKLGKLMDARFGSGFAAELKPLTDILGRALSLTHEPGVEAGDGEVAGSTAPGAGGAAPAPPKTGLSGTVTNRAEAVRAIDLVCEFLDKTEPSNPAPLFLRRARGLLERNFLEIIKELAPAALKDLAASVGVDPASIGPPKK